MNSLGGGPEGYQSIDLNPTIDEEATTVYMSPEKEKEYERSMAIGKSRSDSSSTTGSSPRNRRGSSLLSVIPAEYRQSLVLSVILLVSILLIIGANIPATTVTIESPSSSSSSSSSPLPFTCGECNFQQCVSDMCAKTQPYLCTAGAAAHGCGPDAEMWPQSGSCTSCCSTKNCQRTIAKGAGGHPSCVNECSSDQCAYLSSISDQKCGEEAPYVCLNGSARMGCSDNIFYYAATLPTICSRCCDTISC